MGRGSRARSIFYADKEEIMNDTRAFYWIANQEHYINEAIVSADSVKRHMPDVTTIIGIPGDVEHMTVLKDHFDDVYSLVDNQYDAWFHRLCHYQRAMMMMFNGYRIERAVYMDTDTYMLAPAYDLFDITFPGRYAIAGAHAPGRVTGSHINPIPPVFPEINIGVNPMRVEDCFFLWDYVCKRYDKYPDVFNNNDQGILRETLYDNITRWPLYILPPEYNMRLFPGFVCREVKILHGRFSEGYESVAAKINQSKEMRLWYQNQVLE